MWILFYSKERERAHTKKTIQKWVNNIYLQLIQIIEHKISFSSHKYALYSKQNGLYSSKREQRAKNKLGEV